MRIARISVTRFGPLSDLDVPLDLPLQGGVVVVEGPNEAGKSTLLRFISAILFGGGSVRGALVVEHGGTLHRIEQRGARGTLALTDLGTGRSVDAAHLQRMVGHLDGRVYRQVFAFGLEELQAISTLTGEGVQERIFSAAVAGAGRSVREVQRELTKDIQALWRPKTDSAIRTAARDLRETLALVREAERAAAEWPRLQAEEDGLTGRIASAETRLDTMRADLRRTELLLELHERWSGRRAAREQIAEAPPGEPIPEEAVRRLRTLRPEVDVLLAREVDLAQQVGELEPAASAAVPHEALLPLAEGIAAAVSGVPIQRQRLEEDLPRSTSALRTAEALLGEALPPLGPDWTEERIAGFPVSSLRSADLDAFSEEFEAHKRERIEAEAGDRAALTAVEQARAEVDIRSKSGADLRPLEAEAEIRALVGDAGAHRSRLERLERLRAERQHTEASLMLVLSRLGPAWDEARVVDFTVHAQWRRAAEDAAAVAERLAAGWHKAQVSAEKAQADLQTCRDQLDALDKPSRTAAEADQAVRALRAEIAGLEELGGTLQEWRQGQQDAAAAALAVGAPSLRWPRGWVRPAVAVALPLLLAAWIVRLSPLGAAALVVLAGVLAALSWPQRADPTAQAVVERARAAHEEGERRLEALRQRVKQLGDAAGLATVDLGSVNAALSRARARQGDLERESAACRASEAAAEALRQAAQRHGAAKTQEESARRAEEDARAQWCAWCERNGVATHMRPADVPAFLGDIDRAKELAQGAHAARTEIAGLTAAVDDWRRRVQALAERLPDGAPPSPEQAVQALQAALERATELRGAAKALEEAEERRAASSRRVAALDPSATHLRERWATWCREAGLPELAAPEDARVWIRDARAATEQAARVRALRADVASLQGRISEWEAQGAGLLADAGRAAPEGGGLPLVATISALAVDLRQAEGGAGEREKARAMLQRLRVQLETTRAEIKTKEATISTLLAECGAASEEDLAERLQWQARRQEWQRTVREAEGELGRRAGQDAEAIARVLDEDAPLRWGAEADRLLEQLRTLEAELNDREGGLRARVGELRTRRVALEGSADIARHRLEAEQRKRALGEALRRWVVCRLADGLIGDTLKEYERSHVPEVIRSASERFARVTRGRYQAVHALEGGVLRVATGGDAVLDAGHLSRGTQEQLYLVVRLGLVDSFSRQSESLPLVLDDVLVNSDPERQEGLIRALVDAARDHQTIVLTCHPHASAAILREAPGAQLVRLGRIAGAGAGMAVGRAVGTGRSAVAAAAGAGEAGAEAEAGATRADAEVAAAAEAGAGAAAAGESRAGVRSGADAGGDVRSGDGDPRLTAMALAVLGEHAEGLGSAALCNLLGISAGELRAVVAPLVESGAVVREGRTRGMKYRVGDDRTG